MEGVFISNSLKDNKKYNFIVVFYLMENPQKPGISAALAQAQQWIEIGNFCLRIFLQQRVFTWLSISKKTKNKKQNTRKTKSFLFACDCVWLCCERIQYGYGRICLILSLCLSCCENQAWSIATQNPKFKVIIILIGISLRRLTN